MRVIHHFTVLKDSTTPRRLNRQGERHGRHSRHERQRKHSHVDSREGDDSPSPETERRLNRQGERHERHSRHERQRKHSHVDRDDQRPPKDESREDRPSPETEKPTVKTAKHDSEEGALADKKHTRKLSSGGFGGIPKVDENDDSIPAWKAALLKKQQDKMTLVEREEQLKLEKEETMFEGIPEWKKKLLKKKMAAKAAQEEIEQQEKREKEAKWAEIAAMPEWRRKIFLKKNPQYA